MGGSLRFSPRAWASCAFLDLGLVLAVGRAQSLRSKTRNRLGYKKQEILAACLPRFRVPNGRALCFLILVLTRFHLGILGAGLGAPRLGLGLVLAAGQAWSAVAAVVVRVEAPLSLYRLLCMGNSRTPESENFGSMPPLRADRHVLRSV